MKRFEKQYFNYTMSDNRKRYRRPKILASIIRVLLLPVFLIIRIYFWVWDYDYSDIFIKQR